MYSSACIHGELAAVCVRPLRLEKVGSTGAALLNAVVFKQQRLFCRDCTGNLHCNAQEETCPGLGGRIVFLEAELYPEVIIYLNEHTIV